MKCAITTPPCDKTATWEVKWGNPTDYKLVYWCSEHKEAKVRNSPLWSQGGHVLCIEDDFWKEFNS